MLHSNVTDGYPQVSYTVKREKLNNRCLYILRKSKVGKRVAKSTTEAEDVSVGKVIEIWIYLMNIWKNN